MSELWSLLSFLRTVEMSISYPREREMIRFLQHEETELPQDCKAAGILRE